MMMIPGPKSRAGGIVLSGTLNKNSYCLVSRNDGPFFFLKLHLVNCDSLFEPFVTVPTIKGEEKTQNLSQGDKLRGGFWWS